LRVSPNIGDVTTWNNFTEHQKILWDGEGNKKSVNPLGIGTLGIISIRQQALTYQIQFQNETSDTAFYVIIRDTLSHLLDVQNINPLNASHPYQFQVLEDSIVEVEFALINLPDKQANPSQSRGFINFEIGLADSLPPHGKIYNTAWVSFDFDTPMPTTTTLNTIEGLIGNIFDPNQESPILLFPNPGKTHLSIQSKQRIQHIDLFDINGAGISIVAISQNPFEVSFETSELPPGMYLVKVQLAERVVFAKWMKI
jgi:hypothetical protein